MAQLYGIQEVCFGCRDLNGWTSQLYASAWAYYLLPSGGQILKCTFEVPSWCGECFDFQLAYRPIDLETISLRRHEATAQYSQLIHNYQYKLFGRFFREKKLKADQLKNIIKDCDNIFEFASTRTHYGTARCLSCGSTDVDTRWSDNENNFVKARFGTERFHECGSEICYVINAGHYSPARGQKSVKYDCQDNVINS